MAHGTDFTDVCELVARAELGFIPKTRLQAGGDHNWPTKYLS